MHAMPRLQRGERLFAALSSEPCCLVSTTIMSVMCGAHNAKDAEYLSYQRRWPDRTVGHSKSW